MQWIDLPFQIVQFKLYSIEDFYIFETT